MNVGKPDSLGNSSKKYARICKGENLRVNVR